VWLVQRSRKHLFAAIPAVFMVVTTIAALVATMKDNFATGSNQNLFLAGAAAALLFLSIGVVVVGLTRFAQAVQANARQPVPETATGS